jgi:hypothetical protein
MRSSRTCAVATTNSASRSIPDIASAFTELAFTELALAI